jgi:hypothetical protein
MSSPRQQCTEGLLAFEKDRSAVDAVEAPGTRLGNLEP